MSAYSRTPTKHSLHAKVPSRGSSFAGCFGASTPISPRRTGGHGLLGGQACVNYKKLGFDEGEDEGTFIYDEEEESYEHVCQRRQGPFLQLGKHSTLKEEAKKGMHYASEGEEQYVRERKTAMKLGTQWTMREKARNYAPEVPKEELYASEQEGDEYVRERRSILKLGKLWSMREKDGISYGRSETPKKQGHYHASEVNVYVRERKGLRKLGKLWTMREKARMGVYNASETPKEEEHNAAEEESSEECGRVRKGEMQQWSMREKEGVHGGSPRRESLSLSRRVREACVQVLESARRSSPHLSELFVGNQLLMQVTSSSSFNARRATNVAPSAGFLVVGDPPLFSVSSPASSSSSA